jgi:HAD superfamily hydrolase (TIGR01509 family)
MADPEGISALLYDFDDTIVESERLNDALFSDLLRRRYGISLSNEELDLLYGFSWKGVFDWLRARKSLRPTREEVWKEFLAIKREYLRDRTLRVASGFSSMLELPVAHAIVSGSTRAEIAEMLAKAGLSADSFALILCDEDCQKGKPDPECYLLALRRLALPAGRALAFEDSAAGIEAARGAGISVAFVRELASRDNAAHADLRFESFREVYPWVRGRLQGARFL